MARTPLIRTKTPKNLGGLTNEQAIIYFDNSVENKNENRIWKNDIENIGSVVFPIEVLREHPDPQMAGVFMPVKGIHPIHAEFKLSTYLDRFGSLTIQQFHDNKAQLMVETIAEYAPSHHALQFWGLTADDLEVYIPPAEENEDQPDE